MTPRHMVNPRLWRDFTGKHCQNLADAISHTLNGGCGAFLTDSLTIFADAHLMLTLLMARGLAGSLRKQQFDPRDEPLFVSAAGGQLRVIFVGPV